MADATAQAPANTPLMIGTNDFVSSLMKTLGEMAGTTTTGGQVGQLQQILSQLMNLSTAQGAAGQIGQIYKLGMQQNMPGILNTANTAGVRSGQSSIQALQTNDLSSRLSGQAATQVQANAVAASNAATQLAQVTQTKTTTPNLTAILENVGIGAGVNYGVKKGAEGIGNLINRLFPDATPVGATPFSTAAPTMSLAPQTIVDTGNMSALSGTNAASDSLMSSIGVTAPPASDAVAAQLAATQANTVAATQGTAAALDTSTATTATTDATTAAATTDAATATTQAGNDACIQCYYCFNTSHNSNHQCW